MLKSTAIILQDPAMEGIAESVSNQLSIPIILEKTATYETYVTMLNGIIGLQNNSIKSDPFYIDFASDKLAYRLKKGGGRGELLAKATGINKINNPFVVDMTAGLGRDAFLLASLGCKILMFERDKIVNLILKDGLLRASKNSNISHIISRMHLVSCDASKLSENLDQEIDVIYIDPMFPSLDSKSAPKKEMQIFRKIVGRDQDQDNLLEIAKQAAPKRIVVKRPRKAPYLNATKPDVQFEGKANRYDVYLSSQSIL